MGNEVVKNGQPSAMQLMAQTIERFGPEGAEKAVAIIERLTVLKREDDQQKARIEFFEQLSEFQAEIPPLKQTKRVYFVSKSGGTVDYSYIPIDEIARQINPKLFKRGFSYSWDTEMNGQMKVTIHLRHKNGYEITSSASAPVPKELAKMNEIQISQAVRKYLERNTLVQVLGLTTTDQDTDGNTPNQPLTKDQVAELTRVMKISMPPDDEPKAFRYLEITKIEDLTQDRIGEFKRFCAAKKKHYDGVGK